MGIISEELLQEYKLIKRTKRKSTPIWSAFCINKLSYFYLPASNFPAWSGGTGSGTLFFIGFIDIR